MGAYSTRSLWFYPELPVPHELAQQLTRGARPLFRKARPQSKPKVNHGGSHERCRRVVRGRAPSQAGRQGCPNHHVIHPSDDLPQVRVRSRDIWILGADEVGGNHRALKKRVVILTLSAAKRRFHIVSGVTRRHLGNVADFLQPSKGRCSSFGWLV